MAAVRGVPHKHCA